MKKKALFTLAVVVGAACTDATGLQPKNLSGRWVATEFTMTNANNPSQSHDVLALGGSFTITFRADETFTTTITEPFDGTSDTDTGTFSVVNNVITIAESGQGSPTPVTAVRNGDTMTFTWTDDDFDWDDDGSDDDTNYRIVLTRQ